MNTISLRASKLVSEKPAFTEKEKGEGGGTIYRYDKKHLDARWKLKKKQLKNLNKNIEKLQKKCNKDMEGDDLREKALGAIVSIIIDTGMRIGNPDSVKESDTYGATTLKIKHLKLTPSKAQFNFIGKDQVKQDVFTTNKKVIKVLKELIKGKNKNDFIFEIDDQRIWDRGVNRYLSPFNISAKDIRGFKANKLMEEMLKKKDFDEALEEVADIVGHKPSTLKNQYLDPDLVHKYDKKKKASLSKRAELSEADRIFIELLQNKLKGQKQQLEISNRTGIRTNELIDGVWAQLEPHLSPMGAKITSAIRTPEEQVKVINYYWTSSSATSKYPEIKDPKERAKALRLMGYSISDPDKTTHADGKSFDIGGTDLNLIVGKIKELSDRGVISAKLNLLIEPKNNAVHVNIISASQKSSIFKLANREWKDQLPGGLADKKKPEDFDQEQLELGIVVELEHVNNKQLAKEIAMDHLIEDQRYYDKLKKMEEKFGYISKRSEESIETTLEKNPAAFFIGKYYQKPEFKEYVRQAAIKLLSFKPHLYFTLGLFDEPELADLLDGAMFALANKNPRFFLNTILPLEKFKEFSHLENVAKNALNKKASLSKRAGDVIEMSGIPQSVIDDLKTLPGKMDTLHYFKDENGVPKKTQIVDTVRGTDVVNNQPKISIYWQIRSDRLDPYIKPEHHYKAVVHLIVIDEDNKQRNEQIYREYGSKLIPLINKMKLVLSDAQQNWKKIVEYKYPELFNDNVVQLFPKRAALQEFPKECKTCGKTYDNYEEFFNQPFRNKVVPIITTDDVGLMCGEEWGEPEIDHVYRDCDCKSTLVVQIPCLHKKHISKEAKKHYKAGIFITLPKDLAKDCPSLGVHDDSLRHITALFIGKISKKEVELVEAVIKQVLKEQKSFKVKLDDKVSYFPATESSDNCKVAKLKIISDDLHEFNKKLKEAIKAVGVEIEDKFPSYKPHLTLQYMEEGKEKYDGDLPKGSFVVDQVELWNGDYKKKFSFKK